MNNNNIDPSGFTGPRFTGPSLKGTYPTFEESDGIVPVNGIPMTNNKGCVSNYIPDGIPDLFNLYDKDVLIDMLNDILGNEGTGWYYAHIKGALNEEMLIEDVTPYYLLETVLYGLLLLFMV